MSYLPYVWERNRKIAEGEMKTRTVFDEYEYDGHLTPEYLGAWLLQFDDSWTISLGSEDEPLYVYRSKQVPYTEEEIQAAKEYIANNPKPDQKSVQFHVPRIDLGKECVCVNACYECGGAGWVYDYLGGCGDPECCGGPVKVKCRQCVNDWDPDKEE